MTTVRVVLRPGRDRSLWERHPWVYSGAIERFDGDAADGDLVAVVDSRGTFLAWAWLNRRSKITLRVVSWRQDELVGAATLVARVQVAHDLRQRVIGDRANAYRVVHSDADQIPGLIVDRYGDFLVVQLSSLAAERRQGDILAALRATLAPTGIWHRGDEDLREKEGLTLADGLLWGEPPPDRVEISESFGDAREAQSVPLRLRYWVDVRAGHKTGFYLDQAVNRHRFARLTAGLTVLNTFCYSGAFAVAAHAGGARRVVNVDSSAEALRLTRENLLLNGVTAHDEDLVEANVFELLRDYRDRRAVFDAIVLDPPKFAFRRAQTEAALRGYNDINRLALKLLAPGGVLATFSCSGAISAADFQGMLHRAALDAGRGVQILEHLEQSPDHPELLTLPESRYLTGVLARVF
ncbi:MAG: class I SAM-dependent rRNA methyltransferase [Planctomycetota bacterium]